MINGVFDSYFGCVYRFRGDYSYEKNDLYLNVIDYCRPAYCSGNIGVITRVYDWMM